MSDKKPTVYYFNRCIPITIDVDTEEGEKIEVKGFFASYEPATEDSKKIICKYHYDKLQSKYDELLKESLELAGFYGNAKDWSLSNYELNLEGLKCYGGKRAREFLRKWEK